MEGDKIKSLFRYSVSCYVDRGLIMPGYYDWDTFSFSTCLESVIECFKLLSSDEILLQFALLFRFRFVLNFAFYLASYLILTLAFSFLKLSLYLLCSVW